MKHDAATRRALLGWYSANARDLPFRRTRDPYRILVAEVVLQQTRVEQGLAYLERFLAKFPTPAALARASEEEVLRAWEGLGYYRRARALREAARAIVERHGGKVPRSFEALLELPGVGPYTAGAVASIAFGLPEPAVDGNAARVLSRVFMIDEDPSTAGGLAAYRSRARLLLDPSDPGTFNQALMELGSMVCRPRDPRCGDCPISAQCLAFRRGLQEEYPPRRKQAPVPEVEVAFAVVERKGKVLAVRRIEKGLLSGLWALPGGEVKSTETPEGTLARYLREYGLRLKSAQEIERRRKAFSSRVWDARVFRCDAEGPAGPGAQAKWLSPREREHLPFVPFHREILDELSRRLR